MLKSASIAFGIAFFLAGVLGFIPAAAPDGMLLGLLHVNTVHNGVHLLTGAVAFAAGIAGGRAPKLFFQIFGAVYGVVALLGLVTGDAPILGLIANNRADAWFHLLVAAVSLSLGFMPKLPDVVAQVPRTR